MKRSPYTCTGFAGALVLLFTSCGGNQPAGTADAVAPGFVRALPDDSLFRPAWNTTNTLVYHVNAEPPTLHPTNGNSSPWQELIQYLHAFLVNVDFRHSGLEPGILSLPDISADGLRYRYRLQQAARWDDGSPVTVRDVVFTLRAVCCPLTQNPQSKPYWENLLAVETDPTDTASVTLVMKSSYIQNTLLLAEVPVLQRAFYDPNDVLSRYPVAAFRDTSFSPGPDLQQWADTFNSDRYGRDPKWISGLGPYRLTAWETGQALTLEKKKDYWYTGDGIHLQALPEKIIFRLNRDDVSQLLEFKAQVNDASSSLTMKTLLALSADSTVRENYHIAVMPTFNYTYLAMNERPQASGRPPLFSDIAVRRAMALLTPVDDIIRIVYKEYSPWCRRLSGPVSPLKKECDSTLAPVPYDPAAAAYLLDSAGWKDRDGDGVRDKRIGGTTIPLAPDLLIMNTSSDWKDMAALLVSGCAKAGIRLNVVALDPKVFIEKARAHDFDLLLGVWGGTSHPEDFSQLWHTSSWLDHGNNYPGFGNAASDALVDSINYVLDPVQRAEKVRRLQRMVYDDQPMVFLYCSLRRQLIHRRFHHVELYSERPGILLNTLRLATVRDETNP